MPVDLMYGTPNNTSPTTIPEYVTKLRASLTSTYEQVRTTVPAQLKRQKEFNDNKVHGKPFQPGDLVWLNNPAVPKGRSRKLHCPWTGPYKIVNKLSDAVYRIQLRGCRRKRMIVHFDRLKPCPTDTRFPSAAPTHRGLTQRRSGNTPHKQPPPVGTNLELVEDDSDTFTPLPRTDIYIQKHPVVVEPISLPRSAIRNCLNLHQFYLLLRLATRDGTGLHRTAMG